MALPEIRLLQAAIALAEELNFSRAAERLHLTQPALSKQVFELEAQLGFRLFERNHQIVHLTDAGRAFVEEAREAVFHAERAVMAAKAVFNGADEILNVGKSAYTDPFLVSTLLSVRLQLFPGMRVKLWSNYSNALAHQVIAGTLDLALTTGVPDNPKLSVLNLADNPFYIAMSENDELAMNRELHIEDMHNRHWILLGRHANAHLYDAIQLVASDKGIRPSEIHPVMSPEETPELILEHRGLAFLPRNAAWRISRDGITMRPLSEPQLRLVTNLAVRSETKSRLVKEFVRATSRKMDSLALKSQGRLPLTGS
ncbi:LysR family transcriptional regulator [Granulicella sp. WH15]|uniref:LysR family transcriptional regulator n=1 Tax=Granulicella sp. WH15 TaxID=2602070 RepID=UPI001366CD8B|nr:LysR family transcriptional regulator [Granulicella sp. WH15]QHN03095.1 LysR family transcriptional regulator [Granulicella sp. WH15]